MIMSRFENTSVDELIVLALAASDEEDGCSDGWQAISELRRRGSREIFAACLKLIERDGGHERSVGVDILGQLGYSEKYPFVGVTVPILLELLKTESDPEVLQSIAVAFGHLHQSKGIRPLLKLRKHPDRFVRHAITFAMSGWDRLDAIKVLIELSRDPDDYVRDWATFGLGSTSLRLMPEIREALYARIFEEDEARGNQSRVQGRCLSRRRSNWAR